MMGGNVLANRLNNIAADVIFCVWGQFGLRTKCSCEAYHRL